MNTNLSARNKALEILDHHLERIQFAKGLLNEYHFLDAPEQMKVRVVEEIAWRKIFADDLSEIISQLELLTPNPATRGA